MHGNLNVLFSILYRTVSIIRIAYMMSALYTNIRSQLCIAYRNYRISMLTCTSLNQIIIIEKSYGVARDVGQR